MLHHKSGVVQNVCRGEFGVFLECPGQGCKEVPSEEVKKKGHSTTEKSQNDDPKKITGIVGAIDVALGAAATSCRLQPLVAP